MKSFLRTFLLAGIPSGVFWGFYLGWEKGLSFRAGSGIAAGFLFGLAAAVVARVRQNRVSDSRPLLTEEVILHQARGDYLGLVGWLYLTDRRLLFEGYPKDDTEPEVTPLFETRPGQATGHEVSIPILQISEVVKSKPLGLVPMLDIVLTSGETMRFGTENLEEWIDEISMARQKYLDAPRTEDMKLFP